MRRVTQALNVQNERIMQVAMQQFCKNGYAKTRMEDIAQIIGVTKTPLYYHFKDKAGLFDATFRKAIDDLYANDATIFAKSCCLYDKLVESFVICAISSYQFQIDQMSRILVKEREELSKTYEYDEEMQTRFYELKTKAMSDAKQRGELKPDVDIDELYSVINACYVGVLSWVGGETVRKNLNDSEQEQMIKHLIRKIFSGFKPLYFVE